MKKLDARTLIELILLVVAVIFWGLRKANMPFGIIVLQSVTAKGYQRGQSQLRVVGGAALLAGVLLLAFALLQIIVGLMEIRSFAA